MLTILRKTDRQKIIEKLADVLVIMEKSEIRSYEMQYLIDAAVDICDLLDNKAGEELSEMVKIKHE